MVKLWRCEICGDPYVGETAPDNCPFCGAHKKYIKEANSADVNFDVKLNDTDRKNAEHALKVEISNSAFYFCAAEKTDDAESGLLFKALGKVEAEHASIWKKVLKLDSYEKGKDPCKTDTQENLKDAHQRETNAIEFYRKAAAESENERVKQIFIALVEVETDHLELSEQMMKR